MKIEYSSKAQRNIKKLPWDIQKRIVKKMRFFGSQNDPLYFAKHLGEQEDGEYRFRIGMYRVFFDVQYDTIYVLRIAK